MSHRRLLVTACAALGLALAHTSPLQAQQTTPPPAADRRAPGDPALRGPAMRGAPRRGPATVDDRVARMTAELGLTTDQAAKVRTALTAQQRTADSMMARRAAAQDAERAAMLAMHTNTEKALAGILTPDQKLKHDAMRARQGGRDGMRRGGPARGARRDGRDDRRGPRDDRRSR